MRNHAILILFVLGIFAPAALRAQQSSSSVVHQTVPPATTSGNGFRSHLFVEGAGGGFYGPGLTNGQYVNSGWTVMGGGGYMLGRRIALPAEVSYYHSDIPGPVLQTAQEPGGTYSFWTFSVDPTYYFVRGERFSFFAVGGGGYSHVATNFSNPIGTLNCNVYSGLGYANFGNFCNGNITGSSYSSNQPMYNFGIGMESHLNPKRREILFIQGRYIQLMTPSNQIPGPDLGLVSITGGVRF